MTRVAELSLAALAHVQALGCQSVAASAARLYTFGRQPMAVWRRLATSPDALRSELAGAGGAAWMPVAAGPPVGPWWSWRRRGCDDAMRNVPGWKLYVSPQPAWMIEAIRATLECAADLPVVSAKCGGDAQGILRPDKIVVHLATREAIDELAMRLRRALDGCPTHGVPFTAEVGCDGLLSWGRDPPLSLVSTAGRPSWRSWVTWCLAEGLAAPAASGTDACTAALRHIAAMGVDPLTWAPEDDIWSRRIAA
jgi:hypothetical protein